jgi:type I restriction enzyme M protein
LRFKGKYAENDSVAPLKFFGQDNLSFVYAMVKMNMFIHDMDTEIKLGDTMVRPAFTNADGSLRKFDLVTSNPMWNQTFSQDVYENDGYERFIFGYPPSSTADWGWIQHMYSSLREEGKIVLVIDTGAVSRGSGSAGRNRERDIRKEFVDKDLIEAVILLPENLFYNTTAPGLILVINKKKENKNEILLINAAALFEKGKPKNFLPDSSIKTIVEIYLGWKEVEGISKIIETEEAIRDDYNLSPSRYVVQNDGDDVLSLEDAAILLKEVEEERKEADRKLKEVLNALGVNFDE